MKLGHHTPVEKPRTLASEVGRLRRELYQAEHRIEELEAEVAHLQRMQAQSWWTRRKRKAQKK